jgi:hypothetical protein
MKPIIILGLIISSSAFVYSAYDYGTSEIIARSLVETKPTEDAFNSNIAKLVNNCQCGSELIQIVNKQMKLGESNRSLSTTLAHDSTHNALIQGFL